jgi:putative ABC transport system ATP-binding protein
VESSLIRAVDLCKVYPVGAGAALVALQQVNLAIEAGEFVAVMGPSGSGKSTLMNIFGCLDTPSAGHYYLNGQDSGGLSVDELAELRNRLIGFVFQGFNLLPRKTVIDNVALPLRYAGVDQAESRERAAAGLAQIGLAAYARQRPNQLSGGQQQRVAIARALVNEPRMILADEPTGNLDTHTSEEVMRLFCRLNADRGITLIVVTHEPDIARHARRLIHVVDGRIDRDGPVERALLAARS